MEKIKFDTEKLNNLKDTHYVFTVPEDGAYQLSGLGFDGDLLVLKEKDVDLFHDGEISLDELLDRKVKTTRPHSTGRE